MASKQVSTHAAAAKMIRAYMRQNNIIGSVKSSSYSGGSSVDIYTNDLPPNVYKQLKEYADQFQYGHFDGMVDMYEYSNNRQDIPQVKFVFVNNHISANMRQSIWDFLRGFFSGMENAPRDAKLAGSFFVHNEYGDRLIHRFFAGGYNNSQFWDSLANAQEVSA